MHRLLRGVEGLLLHVHAGDRADFVFFKQPLAAIELVLGKFGAAFQRREPILVGLDLGLQTRNGTAHRFDLRGRAFYGLTRDIAAVLRLEWQRDLRPVTDPVMGFLTDNTRSRWGRRKPYIFLGAIITGLSFVASWLHKPLALNAELRGRQVRNMVLLALAFFVLFYTFPAGMVLYWTTNNLISVIKSLWANR